MPTRTEPLLSQPPSARAAATVVVLRDCERGFEVLLMRRSERARSFGGSFVFPGGQLERADSEPAALQRVTGLSAQEANERLALPVEAAGLALGHWIAVARECFEESGILLAVEAHGAPLTHARLAQLASLREALNAGRASFTELLRQQDLWIAAGSIAYFAHWITPAIYSPRFDTRFFVTLLPHAQQARHDEREMVDSVWLSPGAALQRAAQQQMTLAFVTEHIVSWLSQFDSASQTLAAAQAQSSVVVNRPCAAQGKDGQRLFRRGDAPYAEIHWSDRAESGRSSYELLADVPKALDRYVTRLLAANAGRMTGPGTNTYVVGEDELAVIDPGPDDEAHLAALLQLGAGRIRWILLTHTHLDHAPLATRLAERTGAAILGWPLPRDASAQASIRLDRPLVDEERLSLGGVWLRALHTPGHASNHLCYLLEQTGMLFSGDHLVQGFTVVIAPPDGNMRAYLRSLERLARLELAIVAPGHGYLIGEPRAEIERVIRHRLAREHKVRAALQAAGGRATLASLLPRVYDDVAGALLPIAQRSLLAHLQKLCEDGELQESGDAWHLKAAGSPAQDRFR